MNDLEIAKKELKNNEEIKLVVVKEKEVIYISKEKGIKPLYNLILKENINTVGASAADRVIGRGAAILVEDLEIKHIYGELMSDSAIEKLEEIGIEYYFTNRTEYIENRDRTDLCPVEKMSIKLNSADELKKSLERFFEK